MPKITEDKNTRNDWVEYKKDLWIKENWKDFRDADIEQLFFDFTLEEIKDEYNIPEEIENENQIKEWLEQNVFNFEYYNSHRESWEDIAENEILDKVDEKYQNLLNIFDDCCQNVCEKINDKLIDGIKIDYEITSSHSWNAGKWPSKYAIFTFKIDYNKITNNDIIEDLEFFECEIRFSDGHYNGQDYDFEVDWTDYLRDIDESKDKWIEEIYNQVCNCIDYKICDSETIFIENNISEKLNNQTNYLLNESNKNTVKENLTKEQEEYFKNSKIRDEQGNLLICYHGTSTPGFDEFNHDGKNSQFGNYKFGKYNINFFATNKEVAKGYTDIGVERDGNIYYCYLNIVNPYIVNNETQEDVEKFIFRRWNNIKDKNIRKRQIDKFNAFWRKWGNKSLGKGDVKYVNRDLAVFNVALTPSAERDSKDAAPYSRDEEYYDLTVLGENTLYGGKHVLMYSYGLDEIFEADNYEEIRDYLVGDIDFEPDEYFLTTNDIIRFVLNMNEEEGTNYDGIIIPDIYDIGPTGNLFDDKTTDIITLKSSNQIKRIDNLKPTSSNKINEESELKENLFTDNNILSLLSNTFGTTDEPEATAMYVLPNGRFLFTSPLEPSEDCDYTIDEHRNIDDFLFHKGIITDDRYLEDDGSLFTENVLNCIRFNITDEYYGNYSYIQLNEKQPTSQQYNALLKIFDYIINNRYKYLSIIFDNQYGKQIKLELNDYTGDELLKKIKRFYVSGILTENKNIDSTNKINYNKIEEDMSMEKEIHLKDILDKKDIDIIYVYNDIKDAHFNLTDSLEEDADTDVFNELDMLSMSNENLLNLSEEQLHQIDNLELLDRIAKLDSTKLSTAQLKKLRKAYKEKVIIKEDDVKQLLEQLKQCDRLFITPAPKNDNFLKEHNLYVKECLEILHQLEVADYCASTKSINLNNLGHDLIIFEKDSVTLKDNQKLGPLIIYIKLDLTGSSDSIIVAVSFHEALGLNKQPYYKQIDKNKKETNSIVHKNLEHENLNKDIEKLNTQLKESTVIKQPSFEHSYQYGRVWATNSVSEMKNAILSSSTALRILYDTKHRFYVYANAEDYIHRELLEAAWEFGLYPEYTQRWQFQEGHFEDHTVQLLYAPKTKVKDTWGANIMEDGYTERIEYSFGVITGRTDRASADYLFLNKIPLIKSLKSLEINHTYFSGWNGGEPIIKEVSANTNEQFYEERINNEDGLDEDIEKHDTLNPLLFDENDELKPEIKKAIIKIVNHFIESLKEDGIKINLKDVILVGSNVSYNYTKDSDLDVHLIVDSKTLDCSPELYTLLYGAYRSLFNKNYDITIKGIPVEIYVELV